MRKNQTERKKRTTLFGFIGVLRFPSLSVSAVVLLKFQLPLCALKCFPFITTSTGKCRFLIKKFNRVVIVAASQKFKETFKFKRHVFFVVFFKSSTVGLFDFQSTNLWPNLFMMLVWTYCVRLFPTLSANQEKRLLLLVQEPWSLTC